MELNFWNGNWGLPSIDIDCLHAITYAKIADIPLDFVPSRVPWIKRHIVDFPMCKTYDGSYKFTAEKIIDHFENIGYSADAWIKATDLQDVVSMKALVIDKLRPFLMYTMWLDVENYTKYSRKSYSKQCAFPFNFFVPGRLHSRVDYSLRNIKMTKDMEMNELSDQLYTDAADCLNLLSSFLGNKDYFFGDRPSSFDALLFAHLAVLEKARFADAKLQNYLKGCDNLLRYVNRVLKTFQFPAAENGPGDEAPVEENAVFANIIVPIGVATIAMMSYAVHIGLLVAKR